MSYPQDEDLGPIETFKVEVFGGPYDGHLFIVPRASDGTYGSLFGAREYLWPGLPVYEVNGRLRLNWTDLEEQSRVYEQGVRIIEELSRMMDGRIR